MTATARRLVAVSEHPLDVAAHERAVRHSAGGAQGVFCGVARDADDGRAVVALEYEAHPSAEDVLRSLVDRHAVQTEVLTIAASHRVGVLGVGDVAIVVAVSTAHRARAFEVCARLVDDIKRELPVWKRQVFADGSDEWVNCP